MQNQTSDEALKVLLSSYSQDDKEFWSFRDKAVREHAHIYFQYPAMMVPRMQGQLIDAVRQVVPNTKHIFDPFVGSGTVLTEAMLQGMDFTGQDINPLAILICRAKVGPFHEKLLRDKLSCIIESARKDDRSQLDVDFPGLDKWFQKKIASELSKIRRSIQHEQTLWCRRFCWVALAETVRLTSNSRTSTFKLHVRPEDEIKKRENENSPIDIFEAIIQRNFENLSKQKGLLEASNFLENGYYKGFVQTLFADSTVKTCNKNLCDLLVTSPPYGDNITTVPYGQHSFLPLQWIDFSDIDENIDNKWLRTTQEIDRKSIGGLREGALESIDTLSQMSGSFERIIQELKEALNKEGTPKDSMIRVSAFCRDLNRSLDPILATLKPNAYMIWTIGNRRVADRSIPVDQILEELLCSRGSKIVTRLQRIIPSKRMALRNKVASTMRSETILVLKKESI